ncbi:hypothetical protein [Cerasicoccus arenae]|uniref:Uncharacterized protein n=1 Tax=Cerasicoccus arenae TaxID=424488 RepID=A0A8J3DHA8_9BACT|nr:hypothetical protein [Cerasicoccus arenae]MBK1858234.1 hypothetical protein [Cerasicoccus arenae]GHC02062.1 hypothetical protein GCM10007047_18210 [Cerasicoccus arenae]
MDRTAINTQLVSILTDDGIAYVLTRQDASTIDFNAMPDESGLPPEQIEGYSPVNANAGLLSAVATTFGGNNPKPNEKITGDGKSYKVAYSHQPPGDPVMRIIVEPMS